MKHTLRISMFLVSLTILLFTYQSFTLNKSAEYATELVILYDNDHHGHFLANERGEYGMAARKTLVDRLRKEAKGRPVLYLSGGDINTGTAVSNRAGGIPDIKGMNLLGVDAMAIGNHELDPPLPTLKKQSQLANFPMLSANMYNKLSGQLLFPSHVFLDKGGIKFAVFGLTTPDTLKMVHPANVREIGFKDPIAVAKELVPSLKKQADIVIGLTHLGHFPDGKHGLNASDDVTLARQVPGIDVIVGGHTQTAVCMLDDNQLDDNFKAGDSCRPDQQGSTLIVQAKEWGKYLGELTLRAVFDQENRFKRVEFVSNRLIPVNLRGDDGQFIGEYIPEDPQMLTLFQPYIEEMQGIMKKPLTQLDGTLNGERDFIRYQVATLPQLVIQSQIDRVKADLGILNAGGIRDSIVGSYVTMHDVWNALPFDNDVGYLDLTGKELKQYLQEVLNVASFSGAFPHFRGVTIIKEANEIKDIVVYGQQKRKVVEHETYRVALNSFIGIGGDNYPVPKAFQTTENKMADVFASYLENFPMIRVKDYQPDNSIILK